MSPAIVEVSTVPTTWHASESARHSLEDSYRANAIPRIDHSSWRCLLVVEWCVSPPPSARLSRRSTADCGHGTTPPAVHPIAWHAYLRSALAEKNPHRR